jgi:hypothetical protein
MLFVPFVANFPRSRGGFVVVHRDTDDSVGVYNLLIAAVWALCFVANIFIDSCDICFGDDLDSYATFAPPCRYSLNHSGKPIASCAFLSCWGRQGGSFVLCFVVVSLLPA